MKRLLKMMLCILCVALLLILSTGAIIVGIDSYQYSQNQRWIENFSHNEQSSKTLVVFFSRSGNTEIMARKIAELTKADVLPLRSERNQIGVIGWLQSLKDARNTDANIVPNQVDLSKYDTIYIGSPVWLYSPAPQIYQFAKNHNFSGKKVFLFNSMNSKFEQEFINEFAQIIEKNGGKFVKHLYIIRGRMGQQIPTDIFLQEVERLVQ